MSLLMISKVHVERQVMDFYRSLKITHLFSGSHAGAWEPERSEVTSKCLTRSHAPAWECLLLLPKKITQFIQGIQRLSWAHAVWVKVVNGVAQGLQFKLVIAGLVIGRGGFGK